MASMFEEKSKVRLQFKQLSEPNEIIEFQSMEKFDSEEADEFMKKIMGICAPIHDAKIYDVSVSYEEKRIDPGIPPEIKE